MPTQSGRRTPRPVRAAAILSAIVALGVVLAAQGKLLSQGPGGTGGGGTTLAFVTNNPSDYWTLCRKGCEQAAREMPGVRVRFVMPSPGTTASQKAAVDNLLAAGVQGIAISPVDPYNETTYLNDVAAKTEMITADSDAPQSRRLCYVGTDNVAAGVMAGRLIRRALPRGGQVMLFVGKADARNAADRIRGIRAALRDSRVRVLGVRTDDADHARAKSNAADAMTQYPHIAALVGIWSYNGPAIFSAVRAAGKIGKVKIVAFDQEQDTLDGIQSGAIYGTVTQDPYTFGYRSIKLLAQLARGDRSGVPADGRLIVPTLAVRRGNLAAYEADQARKLGEQ